MGWLINKKQVRLLVKGVKPGVSIEGSYFSALDEKVKEMVTKHLFILKGKKRLNSHHVRCAGAFSGLPKKRGGDEKKLRELVAKAEESVRDALRFLEEVD